MTYNMEIKSIESERVFNNDLRQDIVIEVGSKYIYNVKRPTNKKDRENNGRVVEILGFSDSFMGDAIVRYLDTNRRGRLRCGNLFPYEEPHVVTFYNYD